MSEDSNVVPFKRRRVVPDQLQGLFPRIEICRNDEHGGFVVGIVYSQEVVDDFILCGFRKSFPAAVSLARLKQQQLRAEIGAVQVVDFSDMIEGTDLPDGAA